MDQINQIQLLTNLGMAAFGNTWKADLADSLPVARPTISDWTSGKKPIPVGVWNDIKKILEARKLQVEAAIVEISGKHFIVLQEMQRKHKATTLGQFADYLINMSDIEILSTHEAYKTEYVRCSKECPNDVFIDLSPIKDALDFNICIRNLGGNLDLKLAEDCALSYAKNKKLAMSFGFDDEFFIERTKEIMEMMSNG